MAGHTVDDRKLFEMLVLEGMQAGLSWATILRKRMNFRLAFDSFDPNKIAKYSEEKIAQLLVDASIVRNRRKIYSVVGNARAFLDVQNEFGSFDRYIWRFVRGRPKVNHWQSLAEIPAMTDESLAMSKDLKKRGFKFVGPRSCYAFMQACGLVNDHTVECFRYGNMEF
jgi:DNA-3-methyladenine glycosylase I